ncbi:MAG: dehydrogenase [Armatimonadetes bacterium]|nr:dehydrogenase [Armatimonadota bacterium]
MGRPVTVLGAGNTGFAVAANLALSGYEVTLGDLPEFGWALDPIRGSRQIRLDGVAGRGTATMARVTSDIGEALAASDTILLIVPAYGHRPFAEACAPHLTERHTLVLMPGTLGTLEFAEVLRAHGSAPEETGVTLAESDTAPYVCRKTAPDAAHVWGVVSGLGVGVYPIRETGRVLTELGGLFTVDAREGSMEAVQPYANVLACGLSAMNPVVHPAGVLMNAGRVEYSRGDFYFYEEGVSPAVCAVIEALDAERRAIGRALGFKLTPVHEAFHAAGFGPQGDLWSAINGSRMLTQLRAPGAVNTRWLTEDVPYGIAAWASVADGLGVETPVMDSLTQLGLIVTGLVGKPCGRGLAELGLEGLDAAGMVAAVERNG